MTTLLVWYDAGCPLCRREIALMRRLDHRKAIQFLDVTSAEVACPADLSGSRFEVRLLSGAAAFAAMWRAIPSLRLLGLAARNPLVLAALERLYIFFLRLRPRLQHLARRVAGEPT